MYLIGMPGRFNRHLIAYLEDSRETVDKREHAVDISKALDSASHKKTTRITQLHWNF
jgi:hypothetical protein